MPTYTPSRPPPTDIWAKFDLPNYDDLLQRAQLATRIERTLCMSDLTSAAAARLLDTSEETFAALLRNQLDAYPTNTLQQFLDRLTAAPPASGAEQSRRELTGR